MSSSLDHLRRRLASAKTVGAFRAVFAETSAPAKKAATAQDFVLLDEIMAIRLTATRSGGLLLLAGADHELGVEDAALWQKRGAMDAAKYNALVKKVQTLARRRAGELPAERAAQRPGAEPQAKTLISPWCVDEFGNAVRFVVGVDLRGYRQLIAAGRDAEAELLAEALGDEFPTTRSSRGKGSGVMKRQSAEAA